MPNQFPSIKSILNFAHAEHFDRLDGIVIVRMENVYWYFAQLPSKAYKAIMFSFRNLSQEQK
jgi:hypothetical protein